MRALLGVLILTTGCISNDGDYFEPGPSAPQSEAEAAAAAWVDARAAGWDVGTELAEVRFDSWESRGCSDASALATPLHVTTATFDLDISVWCDASTSPTSQLRLLAIRTISHDIEALDWIFDVRPQALDIPETERALTVPASGNIIVELTTSLVEVTGQRDGARDPMFSLPLAAPLHARIEIDRAVLASHVRSLP